MTFREHEHRLERLWKLHRSPASEFATSVIISLADRTILSDAAPGYGNLMDPMADIFISYASVDRPFARRLADALRACGWSVWWDYGNLRGGQHFHRTIEEAIHDARVVIAVWSKASVESRWVRDEATLALEEDKLVPLRIDIARLPLGFGSIHTIDLLSWTGETEAEPFQRLVKDLNHYLGPANSPSPMEATVPKPPASTGGTAAQAAYDRGDYATALSLARPAANYGDQVAQCILGLLYRNGLGVPQDYAEAMHWYHKAADQGHAVAQNNIGRLYQNGLGVPQDYAEAMRWYHKAADQGDATAQNNIGRLYQNGLGVPQDYAEAMRWYRKAADQGDAAAQFNIGWTYQNGLGVPQDMAQARTWMQKAAIAGNEDAKKWLARN
jgi:hypothetical protein